MYEWMGERLRSDGLLPAGSKKLSIPDQNLKIISAHEHEERSRKGIWEKFLCPEYEAKFGKLDDYAKKILGKYPIPTADAEGWIFGNYDYEQLKLFFFVSVMAYACLQT
jgi:hypothetical protein